MYVDTCTFVAWLLYINYLVFVVINIGDSYVNETHWNNKQLTTSIAYNDRLYYTEKRMSVNDCRSILPVTLPVLHLHDGVIDECRLLLMQARIAELEDELEQERAGRVKVMSDLPLRYVTAADWTELTTTLPWLLAADSDVNFSLQSSDRWVEKIPLISAIFYGYGQNLFVETTPQTCWIVGLLKL